jgi:hypothetical protein
VLGERWMLLVVRELLYELRKHLPGCVVERSIPMPTSWTGLFDHVDRVDVSNRRLAATKAEFDAWAREAEGRAMAELHDTVTVRARELLARTGVAVVVDSRPCGARGPSWSDRSAPVILRLGTSRLDLYSVREPGASPCIHLGLQRGATSTRFPVFATLPGVLLIRSGGAAYEMLSLPLDESVVPPRTNADALALRAFELLLETHRSTLHRSWVS